jgi:hypothetical protein
MPPRTAEDALRRLGLTPAAAKPHIRATFRQLVKTYHPDLHRDINTTRQFVEVVQAYRFLEDELQLGDGEPRRKCPRCGRYGELYDGLDGAPGCLECLFGATNRRRFLPLPIVVTVRHGAVVALYLGSLLLAIGYMNNGALSVGVLSLMAALAGMLVLALTSITVRDVLRP